VGVRGGRRSREARDYPWGDTWQDGFANYNLYNEPISVGTAGGGGGRGRYGHYDMSGNVWEWTRDNWDTGFYGSLAAASPNPVNIAGDGEPITRGGTFYLARPDDEKTFSRSFASRSSFNPTMGVRCARD
jgi:formylglycine-generating enzyme